MARIEGVTKGGSLLARYAFFESRRQFGKVVKPLRVQALLNWLSLMAYGLMELAEQKANKVPLIEKHLAVTLVALRVGCPF
jgi:hypothetical protein